jgi:hypothetical protein
LEGGKSKGLKWDSRNCLREVDPRFNKLHYLGPAYFKPGADPGFQVRGGAL